MDRGNWPWLSWRERAAATQWASDRSSKTHQNPGGAVHEWNEHNWRLKWVWVSKQAEDRSGWLGSQPHPLHRSSAPISPNCEWWLLLIPSYGLPWSIAIGQGATVDRNVWALTLGNSPRERLTHASRWGHSAIPLLPRGSLGRQEEAGSPLKPQLRLASSSTLSCFSHFLTGFWEDSLNNSLAQGPPPEAQLPGNLTYDTHLWIPVVLITTCQAHPLLRLLHSCPFLLCKQSSVCFLQCSLNASFPVTLTLILLHRNEMLLYN